MQLERKDVPVAGIQVLDEDEGVVAAIVSTTAVVDRVKDLIHPGAYGETLKQRFPKGVWGHDWGKPVAKALEVRELYPGDPKVAELAPKLAEAGGGGLYVKAKFNLETQRGRDAFADVKFFEDDQEWSIGYRVPRGGSKNDPKTGVRHIKQIDVYEFSPVLFGAAPLARSVALKELLAAAEEEEIELPDEIKSWLEQKAEAVDHTYRQGEGGDERCADCGQPPDEHGGADPAETNRAAGTQGPPGTGDAPKQDPAVTTVTNSTFDGGAGPWFTVGPGTWTVKDVQLMPAGTSISGVSVTDLQAAIRGVSSSGDAPAAMRRVIEEARQLGQTALIPENWWAETGLEKGLSEAEYKSWLDRLRSAPTADDAEQAWESTAGRASMVQLQEAGQYFDGVMLKTTEAEGRGYELPFGMTMEEKARWREELHPRDRRGRFTEGGSVSHMDTEFGDSRPTAGDPGTPGLTQDPMSEPLTSGAGPASGRSKLKFFGRSRDTGDGVRERRVRDEQGNEYWVEEGSIAWDQAVADSASDPEGRANGIPTDDLIDMVQSMFSEGHSQGPAYARVLNKRPEGVENGIPTGDLIEMLQQMAPDDPQRAMWERELDRRRMVARQRLGGKSLKADTRVGDRGNAGNARHLIKWYEKGGGAARIRWGTPGDFNRCVRIAKDHMTEEEAKGFCNLRHKGAIGIYPATHAAREDAKKDDEAPDEYKDVDARLADYHRAYAEYVRTAGDLLLVESKGEANAHAYRGKKGGQCAVCGKNFERGMHHGSKHPYQEGDEEKALITVSEIAELELLSLEA